MAWVVDTCLLIDIAENDASFGKKSARLLDSKLSEGLILCPVAYAELSPVFEGEMDLQNEFLKNLGVQWLEPWLWQDTKTAHKAWFRYVEQKRVSKVSKRPIADILIGAFASRFDGLLTRNKQDFRSIFKGLELVDS